MHPASKCDRLVRLAYIHTYIHIHTYMHLYHFLSINWIKNECFQSTCIIFSRYAGMFAIVIGDPSVNRNRSDDFAFSVSSPQPRKHNKADPFIITNFSFAENYHTTCTYTVSGWKHDCICVISKPENSGTFSFVYVPSANQKTQVVLKNI